ncbi:MAG: TIR domain-containing protein [Mycoplasmatales bacterium]|nr:TIR domain-containing protein [Mycoplasmatales bacterium]
MARIFVAFDEEKNKKYADIVRKMLKELNHEDISIDQEIKIKEEKYKSDQEVKEEIRNQFLKDVDVTVIVVGPKTNNNKYIDWLIRSSMSNSNQKQGGAFVVVNTLKNEDSWIVNKKLMEEYDGYVGAPWRVWPPNHEMTFENLSWLPHRLAKSATNNYDQEEANQRIYNYAIFPIIHYAKLESNINILRYAIQQSLELQQLNRGKWDTLSQLKRDESIPKV